MVDVAVQHEFEKWYRELYPTLVGSLAGAFGDLELAREAADEAVVRAFEKWDRVASMASPAGWTYRVAFNFARRKRRREAIERQLYLRVDRAKAVVEGPSGEIWLEVARLPLRQRMAVVLRHVGGLSEPEIAKIMGISRGGVSTALRCAYSRMRANMEADGHV